MGQTIVIYGWLLRTMFFQWFIIGTNGDLWLVVRNNSVQCLIILVFGNNGDL